jgi:predicted ArsR family transcriptional regulator
VLADEGSATATRCAERLGESPASCSFHLRTLARHGFIEEAPGGVGRERPWRLTALSRSWTEFEGDPAATAAARELTDVLLARELELYRAWRETRADEPPAWAGEGSMWSSIAYLTAEELAEMRGEVEEMMVRHLERLEDPARRPPGARAVRLLSLLYPQPGGVHRG